MRVRTLSTYGGLCAALVVGVTTLAMAQEELEADSSDESLEFDFGDLEIPETTDTEIDEVAPAAEDPTPPATPEEADDPVVERAPAPAPSAPEPRPTPRGTKDRPPRFDPRALPAEATPIGITLEPSRFVLGSTEQATIVLELEIGADTAVPLRLLTNAGRIDDLRRDDRGRLVATYHPPEQLFPQVAIIAASADVDGAPHVGWTAVPLYGQGTLQIPGRIGTEVEVKIGEESFGPVAVGENGKAEVRVEVPPGYRQGSAGRRRIPLGAAPFSPLLVLPQRSWLLADGRSETGVYIFVVTERGEPREGASVRLETNIGRVGRPQLVVPGVYATRLRSADGAGGRAVGLVARVSGAWRFSGTATVEMIPRAPDHLALSVVPTLHRAGEDPPMVAAMLLDEEEHPVTGWIAFSTDTGQLDVVRETAPGTFAVQISPPTELPPTGEATITARAWGGEDPAEARVTLALHAGEPAAIEVVPSEETATASGRDPLDVELRVRDQFGNPVEGARVALSASQGDISAVEEAGGGRYLARYTPSVAHESTTATLSARAGDHAAGEAVVQLSPQGKRLLVGVQGGLESNFVALHAPVLAVDSTLLGWGLLSGAFLRLELAALMAFGETTPQGGPLAGQTISRQLVAFPISLFAGYRYPLTPQLALSAGLGAGVGYAFSGAGASADHLLNGALHAQLGGDWAVGPGEVVMTLRYTNGGLEGGLGGITLMGGYSVGVL